MTTFRSTLPEVYEDREAELFHKRYAQEPLRYTEIFNIVPVTKGYDDAFRVSGLGTFHVKPEGTQTTFDDPVQGDRVRLFMTTFALGYRVTMEAREDALYDVIDRMPSDLGDSGRDHQENFAWAVFNNGFSTVTTLDGVSFFNTAHVLLKPKNPAANTVSNQLSPGVALTVTGLEDARTNLRLTKSEEDRQIPISPAVLLIHPNEEHNADKLLDSKQEPFTADNQINANMTSNSGIRSTSVPYLTDVDAWFLGANKDKHSVNWYNRKSMTFDSGKDSQTKDDIFDAHYRAEAAPRDWRGWVGSQP